MIARARVNFIGRVQGVFFRANTFEKARECGVFGWVRNLPDGSVEAIFEGDEKGVKEVIEWCRTSQPLARVDEAQINWEEFAGEFKDFSIRREHFMYRDSAEIAGIAAFSAAQAAVEFFYGLSPFRHHFSYAGGRLVFIFAVRTNFPD